MRTHLILVVFLGVALCPTAMLRAQVEPSASGGPTPEDDSVMMTPPPVSGMPYAHSPSSEARTNYLSASVAASASYIDNVLPYDTASPIGDGSFSILPSVALSRSTSRQAEVLSYNPTFTFYEPTSVLDTFDQSASLGFQFRFAPRATLSLVDSFVRTSNVFNEADTLSAPITGSSQPLATTVIAPYAEQMTNSGNGVLSYQFSRNAMIGGGGSFATFTLPNPTQTQGLYNTNEGGGNIFYSRRLSRSQYIGLSYNYNWTSSDASSGRVQTQENSWLPFYTIYINRTFSISIAGGLSDTSVSPSQSSSLSPSVIASLGWQAKRASLAASVSHSVSAMTGLLGAFSTTAVAGSASERIGRLWNGGLSASYETISNAFASSLSSFSGGNTLSTQISLGRSFSERLTLNFAYQHLHEDYPGLAVVSADPDSNRESVTLTYSLKRPLGR